MDVLTTDNTHKEQAPVQLSTATAAARTRHC
jgi:hypothetical protein